MQGYAPSLSPTQWYYDHTDFATQVSGQGVFQKQKGFEIEKKTVQVESDGTEFEIAVMNTASVSINSLSVTLNGVPLYLGWGGQLPLQPNMTASAAYNIQLLPQGSLPLSVGTIYQLNVTAYFSDGTNMTQSAYAILTGL